MDISKKNVTRYVIATCLHSLAVLCCSGPILQTFLVGLGFSTRYIYLISSISQVANVLTISLCSSAASRKDPIKLSGIILIPQAVLYLLYIPLCIKNSASAGAFLILVGISLFQTVCSALYTIYSYQLPYYLYHPEDYSKVQVITGILGSLISLGTGIVISRLSTIIPYSQLMLYACCFSALLMIFSAAIHFLYQSLIPIASTAKHKGTAAADMSLLKLFKYPLFRNLIPANFLRGFASGTTSVIAAVALDIGYDQAAITALVSLNAAASILASCAYSFCTKHIPIRGIILLGGLAAFAFPLILTGNTVIFYISYAVFLIGCTFIGNAIPYALLYAVPVEYAGMYNSWRMLLLYAGTFLGTTVAAMVPVSWLVALTVFCQLFVGFGYYLSRSLRQASTR